MLKFQLNHVTSAFLDSPIRPGLVLESIFLPEELEFRARSNYFGEEPIHDEQSCCFTSDARTLQHMHEPFHENDRRVTMCV